MGFNFVLELNDLLRYHTFQRDLANMCTVCVLDGVQQQIKDTCGSGKERMGREDEGEKTMDNCVVAVLERMHFLPGSQSDIKDEKEDEKTKSVQHYSACLQL